MCSSTGAAGTAAQYKAAVTAETMSRFIVPLLFA